MKKRLRKRRNKGLGKLPMNTSISIGCGIIDLIIIIIMTIKSTISNGDTSILTGLIGLLCIAISGYGIYYAIKGFKEDDTNYITAPLIAIITNSIITIFLIVLYVIGIFV